MNDFSEHAPDSVDKARAKLFDLAINRSLSVASKLGKLRKSNLDNNIVLKEEDLRSWHQQTRFAYRISLEAIVQCLNSLPDTEAKYYWEGGAGGAWFEGKTSQP